MRIRRWIGALVLVAAVAAAVYWRSEAILRRDDSVPLDDRVLDAGPNPGSVVAGDHFASSVSQCQFCHGANLAGKRVIDDPWIGRLYTANLTRGKGGIGSTYRIADWVRAIRFGVGRDGRSLLLQPSRHLSAISDFDLAAMIVFLRQVPAVDRELPSTRIGPVIRVGMVLGLTPDLISAAAVDRTRKSPREIRVEGSAAYGAYLADVGNCRFCHGEELRGGLHPLARAGEPVPANLRREGSMAEWSREDFDRAMREGRTPDGRRLDPEFMPWLGYAGLNALEIDALWQYLRSLRP